MSPSLELAGTSHEPGDAGLACALVDGVPDVGPVHLRLGGTAMGHVRQMGHVDVSPERAFALTVDAERDPEWSSSVVEVKDVTGLLDRVGASYTTILKLAGRRLETRWEATKVEKPRLLELAGSAPGGGHAISKTTFEPAGGGTDITVEVDYELPGGFVGGMADKLFVERAIERDVKHSLENFKAICEAEEKVPA